MHAVAMLLDSRFRIACSTYLFPDVDPSTVIGQYAWEAAKMPPGERRRMHSAITKTYADGRVRSYVTRTESIGTWRTWVHKCCHDGVSVVLIATQMPAELGRLAERDRRFLCAMLETDNKHLAQHYRCSAQAVSNRRARLAKKLGVRIGELRAFAAMWRTWLE